MASTQLLRRRIRSVRNTQQITKAMELVAAAKMRRVQSAVEGARIYGQTAMDVLARLAASPEATQNPYFSPASAKAKLYVIITSDTGLAGAFNANILNLAHQQFKADKAAGVKSRVIAIGKKGAHHMSHLYDVELIGEYENMPDNPDTNVFAPLIETMHGAVTGGYISQVQIIYTQFVSSLNQKAVVETLVPIKPAGGDQPETRSVPANFVYEFEPDLEVVLEEALRVYLESALRRGRVESAASEHASRMLSMNNANRNAGDLIDNLTLELNATRQAAITQEMAEIIGGADAIA